MKKLRTLQTDVTINASKEKIWDALFIRFGDVHLFHPGLDGSHFIKGGRGEVGCERQCDLNSSTKVVERITQAQELETFTVEIVGGNMPMIKTFIVDLELREINSKKTTLVAVAHFNTSPAFMGIMVKGMMKAKLTDMLIGLKYHLETGKTVSKQTYKPVSKMYQRLQPGQSFQIATR
ncbi:MAG: SRPBCC family protein [Bacteroidota bacterium]|nr:SRPBCC family protein [Bacteroidota bacterium]